VIRTLGDGSRDLLQSVTVGSGQNWFKIAWRTLWTAPIRLSYINEVTRVMTACTCVSEQSTSYGWVKPSQNHQSLETSERHDPKKQSSLYEGYSICKTLISPSGNWTPVSRVDTHHYTNEDWRLGAPITLRPTCRNLDVGLSTGKKKAALCRWQTFERPSKTRSIKTILI